jgi:hypothetical protein
MTPPLLWHYQTKRGEDAVTDRWEDIPPAQRSHAQPLGDTASTTSAAIALPAVRFDPASFVGGALLGAVLALLLTRRRSLVLKLAVTAVALVVSAGLYLGFLRRSTGMSNATFSSPSEIVGEVQGAAGAMKDHFGEQQRALEQIEAGGK